MLDDFIRRGEAYFDQQRGKLSLSHPTVLLELSQSCLHRKHIRSLSLNHCDLHSLLGIQQFPSLQQLSIRYNHIQNISQIYRISNKHAIQQLDFVGNDIQYLGGGLFINLVIHFPNLIELNGRNYFQITHTNTNKQNCMKKIVARSNRISKQLLRIATKQDFNNRPSQTEPYQLDTPNQRLHKNKTKTYEEEEQSQSSVSIKNTEKKKSFAAEQQKSCLHENADFVNRNMQNDVSLGAISIIPMTKSVSGSCGMDRQPKRRGLQIFTLNESMQGNRLQVAQPTATFAMQREKQNLQSSTGFMFKNREKTQKYRNVNTPIEQDQQDLRFTKRENQQHLEEDSQPDISWGSELEDSLMREERLTNKYQRGIYADAYFAKVSLIRAFVGWKGLRGNKNLPMRRR